MVAVPDFGAKPFHPVDHVLPHDVVGPCGPVAYELVYMQVYRQLALFTRLITCRLFTLALVLATRPLGVIVDALLQMDAVLLFVVLGPLR